MTHCTAAAARRRRPLLPQAVYPRLAGFISSLPAEELRVLWASLPGALLGGLDSPGAGERACGLLMASYFDACVAMISVLTRGDDAAAAAATASGGGGGGGGGGGAGDARGAVEAFGAGVDAVLRHPAVPPAAGAAAVASLRMLGSVVGRRAGAAGTALRTALEELWRALAERLQAVIGGGGEGGETRRLPALRGLVGAVADEAGGGGGGALAGAAAARIMEAAAGALAAAAAAAAAATAAAGEEISGAVADARGRALDVLVEVAGAPRAAVWSACAGSVAGFDGARVMDTVLSALRQWSPPPSTPAGARRRDDGADAALAGVFGVGAAFMRSSGCDDAGATWDRLVTTAIAVGGVPALQVLYGAASAAASGDAVLVLRQHPAADAAVVAAAADPSTRAAACALCAARGGAVHAVEAVCRGLAETITGAGGAGGGCVCAVAADLLLVLQATVSEARYGELRRASLTRLFSVLCLRCARGESGAAWARYNGLLCALPTEGERSAVVAHAERSCSDACARVLSCDEADVPDRCAVCVCVCVCVCCVCVPVCVRAR